MNKKKLELYLHIPFCVRKCAYCDFLSFAAPERMYREYVDKLIEEIYGQSENFREYQVVSIFVGGGTPSLLPASLMEELFAVLHQCFDIEADAEITIEANPGTLTMEKLELYRQSGINRLSLGLQSADDQELNYLGRIHTYEDFLKSYQRARQAGFTNINVDLMSALPGQDLHSWKTTLRKVLMLKPEHISAYSLILEEGTPFFERYEKGLLEPASEELDREMYHWAVDYLAEQGYGQYEISNFARTGKESRHNCIYWRAEEYLGLGLGAHSYLAGERFHNPYSLRDYIAAAGEVSRLKEEVQQITREDALAEFMFLGLRLTEGASFLRFRERFGTEMQTIYGKEISELINLGLLEETEKGIRLTRRGIDVSNVVFEKFLLS